MRGLNDDESELLKQGLEPVSRSRVVHLFKQSRVTRWVSAPGFGEHQRI
jgi:hypothetical protein